MEQIVVHLAYVVVLPALWWLVHIFDYVGKMWKLYWLFMVNGVVILVDKAIPTSS